MQPDDYIMNANRYRIWIEWEKGYDQDVIRSKN